MNRLSKYLVYAIGEIILVAIGILIALKVNNYNNDQQQLKKEIYYLNEIKNNLVSDTVSINSVLAFLKHKDSLINVTAVDIAQANSGPQQNSILVAKLDALGSYDIFKPNRIGFENMMSAENVELITNDSIRKKLSDIYYYDFNSGIQQRQMHLTMKFIDFVAPKLMTKEMLEGFYKTDNKLPTTESINFNRDPLFFSHIQTMQFSMRYQRRMLELWKDKIKNLINLISKDLEVK